MARIDTESTIKEYAEKISHNGYTPKDIVIRSTNLTQAGIDAGFTRSNVKNTYVEAKNVNEALEILETTTAPSDTPVFPPSRPANPDTPPVEPDEPVVPDPEEPDTPEEPTVQPTPPFGTEMFTINCDVSNTVLKVGEYVSIPPIIVSGNISDDQNYVLYLAPENCAITGFASKPTEEYDGRNYGAMSSGQFDEVNAEFANLKVKANSKENVRIAVGYDITFTSFGNFTTLGYIEFKVA